MKSARSELLALMAQESNADRWTGVLITDEAETRGHRYGSEMRVGFRELDIAAYFCIDDVPSAAIMRGESTPQKFESTYLGLWNQGLVNTLIKIDHATVDVYSLLQSPKGGIDAEERLVQSLTLGRDALAVVRLFEELETGAFYKKHQTHFRASERVDELLLTNLGETVDRLMATGLPAPGARALVIQTMFLCYLEDRGLLRAAFNEKLWPGDHISVAQLLEEASPAEFESLFEALHERFNGNVFFAPCSFGAEDDVYPLTEVHLSLLRAFRTGTENLSTGQTVFWPYQFQYIPVELISAIYDRLLSGETKKKLGSYFTPRHLAEFSVARVWAKLSASQRLGQCEVLDPACGSGIFLVSFFKRIVAARQEAGKPVNWKILKELVGRLHGVDPQEAAVRLAITSLYIAMIEVLRDSVTSELQHHIPLFPPLLGKQMSIGSFFCMAETKQFDVVLGNPPWASRTNRMGDADAWCAKEGLPSPSGDCSWAFIWKSMDLLSPRGVVALLVPAMGVLHNNSREAVRARQQLVQRSRVIEVVNFSDISFQLFDDAKRPTALLIAKHAWPEKPGRTHYIEYLCPKATPHFRITRSIEIDGADRHVITEQEATVHARLWKELLWATARDRKLLGWLRDLPSLRARFAASGEGQWRVGQGFKPAHYAMSSTYSTVASPLKGLPVLPATEFEPFAIRSTSWPAHLEDRVHRAGFVDAYRSPKILIPQGIQRKAPYLRAAYTERHLAFEHSLQAITFPQDCARFAKFLTLYLNSSLAAWFLFHTSSNLGTDRAKVLEDELKELPCPDPRDVDDPIAAHQAIDRAVALIDEWSSDDALLTSPDEIQERRASADEVVFQYFGLTEAERIVICDTVRWVMPSIQSSASKGSQLSMPGSLPEIRAYGETLREGLAKVLHGVALDIQIFAGNPNAIAVSVRKHAAGAKHTLNVRTEEGLARSALSAIKLERPNGAGEGMRLIPTVAVWNQEGVTLVKSSKRRNWLRMAALNDVDALYAELVQAKRFEASSS